ncbi:hypothetical protein HDV02_005713 [Globomyces sp. JEL0801]|nr:hypothetical protein HDV02_005713 [Globomyces sp. JEL0801]
MNIVTDSLILNLNQFESTMKIAIQSNSAQIKMKGKCVSKSQYTNLSNKSCEDLKEFQSQDPTFDLSRVIQIKSDDANIDSNIEHYNVYNVICNNTTLKHQMTGKQGQLTDIKFTNGKVQVLLVTLIPNLMYRMNFLE